MKRKFGKPTNRILGFGILVFAYFMVEVLCYVLLRPEMAYGLLFGLCWAVLFATVNMCLPRLPGRIFFGITYYLIMLWGLAQSGYYQVFGKLMWISSAFYAGEGVVFIGDVLQGFTWLWWVLGVLYLVLGVVVLRFYPKKPTLLTVIPFLILSVAAVVGLCLLPELVFQRDNNIKYAKSEFGRSSSYRTRYETMYDAKCVYDICGVYQLLFRDVYQNEIYPLTPAYRKTLAVQTAQVDNYFKERGDAGDNDMTGIYKGKNVVLVLMESIDDYLVTEEDTPTLYRMMQEGISFTNFYSPGYGAARTFNTEFCMNTGIYLPTTGTYVFDYVNNAFNESFASRATAAGYNARVFHYNNPEFYSRGVFEPVMGYESYISYEDYTLDKDALYDDCTLFENQELNSLFFREGQTFNTIITRSAHLSYKYNEVLSWWGMKKYPEYKGKYGSEEEDCARMKAKLVDDMFARLLQELEEKGQLENTVIIGITDHYTYGYKNVEEMLALSGVNDVLELEKTPCFCWSAGGPAIQVDKALQTADFLPTMLNLLGLESPYRYLGQDAFDPDYAGYVFFPDGSWVTDGIFYKATGEEHILQNKNNTEITNALLNDMAYKSARFIEISNRLLTCNYYQ